MRRCKDFSWGPTDPYFRRHYPKMAMTLRDEGYAVFLLDYHSAEGVISACLGEVTTSRIAEYVVTALRSIAADPRVDREDISIIGWSLGGAGLLRAVELLVNERASVSAAIAIYPGCAGVAPWSHELPVHLFLGDADNIAPAETCRSFVETLDSSLPVFVTSYPGPLYTGISHLRCNCPFPDQLIKTCLISVCTCTFL